MPWKTINDEIHELRTKNGGSKEDSHLFGETVTHLMNGMDAHFNAVQSIREWCGLAKSVLTAYNQQLNKAESSAAQKTLLVRVLGNEIDKMNRAEVQLTTISTNFHQAAGKLTTLQNRLKNKSDADSKSMKRFAESLGHKLNKAHTDIDETKTKLQDKIRTIENLKVQIEKTESYVSAAELRNIAVQSVQNLIADCNEYSKIQTL